MKKLSTQQLSQLITTNRKKLALTQQDLADKTGINRSMISRMEAQDYLPSIPQLEQLANCLNFDLTDVFVDDAPKSTQELDKPHKIAVAGTGYVGMSLAVLLSHHNHVTAVDVVPKKVDLINQRKSPIQDDYIEKYLAEKNL